MPSRNLVSWTGAISPFILSGHAELGLQKFFLMCNSGLSPDESGFSLALKASRLAGQSAVGKLLHGCTIKSGFESYAFCSTSILSMYAKCGSMSDARRLFDGVPLKSEALWNTLLYGCTRSPDPMEAIGLFHQMLLSDTSPNSYTYTILINSSAGASETNLLRFFHGRAIITGFDKSSFVGGALVDAYAKWGDLSDASRMFWSLDERDHVVWSALLAGIRHVGDSREGLDLYLQFLSEGYRLDPFLFSSVFNLCADLGAPKLGLQVHCCLTKSGFVVDSFVGSALIDMYASFGTLADAHGCFLDTTEKNEAIFGAMIHGFVCESDYRSALELVSEMRRLGLKLDHLILNCMLRAYASLDMLEGGRVVHGQIMKTIEESYLITGNTLLEMYAKCKAADEAAKVFMAMEVHNEFSWTTLISGYTESERYEDAMKLFDIMQSSDAVKPNQFTLVAVLQAISKLTELHKGRQIHGFTIKLGFHSHAYIESALIRIYSECDRMDDAFQLFSNMTERDLVSWSTMISAFVQHGQGEEALKLFREYQDGFVAVDESILSSCLSACSSLPALEIGRCIHVTSIKTGFESDLQVIGATINMYCRCGSIGDARRIFDTMRELNVVCYTVMVCGYAHHGLGQEAIRLFNEMREARVEPDGVTFVGILSACSHLGLVKEGWHYFESMQKEYRLERTVNHYACMVDLLGRAGQMSEAEELINMAPFPSRTSLWRTLLGACNKHGDIEVGSRIAQKLIRFEPDQPSDYVLLSNIYASASLWDHSIQMKNKIKVAHTRKTPGCSWIEVAN